MSSQYSCSSQYSIDRVPAGPHGYLGERAASLRKMLNTVPGLVCGFGADGQMLAWNRHFCEVTGYHNEEIADMQLTDFAASSYRDELRQHIQFVLQKGETTFEMHLQTKDGQQIPHEFSVSSMEEDGQLVICGVGRDIRQRKLKDEKRRRSEEKYRRLFEESQEGILITATDGTILDANPALCSLSGYSLEDLLSMNVRDLYIEPAYREELMDALLERDVYREFEAPCRRANGAEIICRISASVWRDPSGRVEAVQSFIQDVTDEKEALQALEESEEKFRRLAEESPVGIGLVQDGILKYVNPAQADMFGYRREEMTGRPNEEFVHQDDLPYMHQQMERRLRGEAETVHYMFRGITKGGSTRLFEVRGGRVRYKGKPAVVGTVIDLTERRRLQREVLRIQEEERRRIGQDLHDGVGSYLSGLSMALNALVKKANRLDPEFADELKEISEMVEESSYDVRRLSRGLNPLTLEDEGLKYVLDRLTDTGGNEEEVIFKSEGLEQLSDLSDEVATHLYWIVQEALTNARKYAEGDRVVISVVCNEKKLTLMVSDDGRGFDESTKSREGLGLRTMRYRAELLGGTLNIDSTPGEGTTVRCRLPVDSYV